MTLVALGIAVLFIVLSTARYKINPFMVLIVAGVLYGLIVQMPLLEILKSIQDGFGGTIGYIGIVIIAGTMMGVILERTGAAFAITNAILKIVSKRYPNLALSIAGYVTSIAVFCDSGFVILNSINKALAKKAKLSITVTSVSLATGLFASHCLIPPATGPIAAAQIVGVNIGELMLVGLIVAFFAAGTGFLWATFYARKYYVEPKIEKSYDDLIKEYGELPSAFRALMPILVPIVLILLASLSSPKFGIFPQGDYIHLLHFIGSPTIALVIGVFVALILLVPRKDKLEAMNSWFGEGIKRAAIIVALTGAGGAFGAVLKASPIGEYLGQTLSQYHMGIFLPFIISAALKTAQGSSTVALLTASSIIAPMIPTLGIDPVLAVAAIGAGAMTFSHANDSYFWVVTTMSDMEASTSYRVYTVATMLVGFVSIMVIYALSHVM